MKSPWIVRIQIALYLNLFLLANAVAGDWWVDVKGLEWMHHYHLAIHTSKINDQDQLITASLCREPKVDSNFQSIEKCVVPPGKRVFQVYLSQAGIDLCRQWQGLDSFAFPQSLLADSDLRTDLNRGINKKIANGVDSAEHPFIEAFDYYKAFSGEKVGGHWDPCAPLNKTSKVIDLVNSLRVEESLSLLVKPLMNSEVFYVPGETHDPAIDRFALYFIQKIQIPGWIRKEFNLEYLPDSGSFPQKNEYYSPAQKADGVLTVRKLLVGRSL